MKQRPRIYYTEEQKALMWDRWQQGESLNAIARLFDRHHSAVSRIFAETGGIRPVPRQRSRLALTLDEREEISRGIVAGRCDDQFIYPRRPYRRIYYRCLEECCRRGQQVGYDQKGHTHNG